MKENNLSPGGDLSNIFISFAAQDQDFVSALDAEFKKQGRELWIDWKADERPGDREQEVYSRIEAADNFIFVVSPEAIESEARKRELAHAAYHHKRLIPLVRSDVSAELMPQTMAGISPVHFRPGDDFVGSFRSLINRIDADLKLDIFISYSRKDGEFVQMLEEAFRAAERRLWVDRKNIQHTEEWLKAIYSGIEAADNFLFIISPDSVVSKNCGKELAHAVEHNKRLVPIIRRNVDDQLVPQAMAELDWVPFREADDFSAAFKTLLETIDTDLDYVRAHTRLLVRAIEWDKKGRDKSLLLRGKDLREAEQWLVQAGAKKPRATALQSQYITASRQDANKRQRIILAAITAGLVITIALAIWAVYQYRVAEAQRREAQRRLAAFYEEQGRQELLGGSPMKALAYLNEAYQEGSMERSLKFLLAQASRALVGQISSLDGHTQQVRAIAVSRDGQHIVSGSDDGEGKVWEASSGKLLFTLKGHRGGVRSVAFSPDNSKIVTASLDQTAKVWDATNGTLLATLDGHENTVNSAEFSHNGKFIVTASDDKTAIIWDAELGNRLFPLIGHQGGLYMAAFSPDDKLLMTTSLDNTANIWDAAGGKLLASLKGHSSWVDTAAFSPDGKRIVTGSYDNSARIWEAQSGKLLATLHKDGNGGKSAEHDGPITSVTFSNDGSRILTSSWDKTARIWDGVTGQLLTTLSGHDGKLNLAVFNGDGTRVMTASEDSTVKMWDATGGELLASLDGHSERVNTVAFMPDNRYVVTAGLDKRAIVWDWTAAASTMPTSLKGHENTVSSASFSPDGKLVVSASTDGTAKLWDAASGAMLFSLNDGKKSWLKTATFSPDGKLVVTSGEEAPVTTWDVATGKPLISLEGYQAQVNSALFDSSGQRIITSSGDTTARIWDASNGQQLSLLQGHKESVNSAIFSRDSSLVVTASDDGTAKVWEASTGKMLISLDGHTGPILFASFSPDGSRAVTASSDKTAKLWEVTSGKLLASLNGHTGTIITAAFSPDGTLVITASQDRTAKVWNASSGTLVVSLDGHLDEVKSASFDNESKRVVTASDDKTVKVWDAGSGRLLASLEGHTQWVESAAFSPNDEQVVTASDDHTVKIWDLHLEKRNPEEMNAIVKRRVPFRLDGGRLLPTIPLSLIALSMIALR